MNVPLARWPVELGKELQQALSLGRSMKTMWSLDLGGPEDFFRMPELKN